MSYPLEPMDRYRVHSSSEWSVSEAGNRIATGCAATIAISLVAMFILRSPLLGVPAFGAIGYYLGKLAKKRIVEYNAGTEFLLRLYHFDGRLDSFRYIVLGIVFIASYVFPIGGAVGATACGAYLGLVY